MLEAMRQRVGLGIASLLTAVGTALPALVRILEDPQVQQAIETRDVVTGVLVGASVIGGYQAGRKSEREQRGGQ